MEILRSEMGHATDLFVSDYNNREWRVAWLRRALYSASRKAFQNLEEQTNMRSASIELGVGAVELGEHMDISVCVQRYPQLDRSGWSYGAAESSLYRVPFCFSPTLALPHAFLFQAEQVTREVPGMGWAAQYRQGHQVIRRDYFKESKTSWYWAQRQSRMLILTPRLLKNNPTW
jgi:hypothetical protein